MNQSKLKKISFIFFLHIFIIIVFLYGNTIMHEQFHYSNGKYFGCINATISYNWHGGSYRCNKYSEFQTEQQQLTMSMMDSVNDAISYNLVSFALLVVILSMTIFLSIVEIFGGDENEKRN
jgi:hypothetical protein